MKLKSLYLIIFTMFFAVHIPYANAETANSGEALKFVEELSNQAIHNVVNADIDKTEKVKRFRKLFEDAVDIPTIARFVLGRHWRSSSNKEKSDFLKAFKNIIILSWSKRFDDYAGQSIKFTGTRETGKKDQIYVVSKVIQPGGETIEVIWRLRMKDSQYKVVDISIASASMALTYKKEYSSVIRNKSNGMQGLIDSLEQKISQIKEELPETATALYE